MSLRVIASQWPVVATKSANFGRFATLATKDQFMNSEEWVCRLVKRLILPNSRRVRFSWCASGGPYMPHSVDEAMQIAEQLEREAHDQIVEKSHRLEEAVKLLRGALAIREAYQGEAHPDLIWTLSLWIYALRRKHRSESAPEAARLGERRLALRRTALAGAPDELARSLRELIDLYTFEDDVFDMDRVDELRRELAAFPEAGGAQREA